MEENHHHSDDQSYEQQILYLLQQISLTIAQAETLDVAFAEVLAAICRFMGWPLGHLYIWSEASNTLVSGRIWYTADAAATAPFRALSEATQFQRGEGTVGKVWQEATAVSILDVREETLFVRQMPEGGIRAYFAFPVLVGGKVTAVLEFFSPESVALDRDMTSIIQHVSTLLGLAMQRQQTLTRLQQSEAQLAEAQRTAQIGHWEWDVVHNKVTWSPELHRIFGLSSNQFEANYEAFLARVHPDDLAYVQHKIEEAYQNARAFDYYHRIIRPDGAERVLHACGRPIYDQAGQIVKLYGTAQDMTRQKEVELKLAQTVRQLSTLMEVGQAISATLDFDLIYDQVLTLVRPLIGAESLILFVHKEQLDEPLLEIVANDQTNMPDMRGLRVPFHLSVAGEVWQTGASLHLQGDECIGRISPKIKELMGYRPEAMLAVPLRWRDKGVGVLEATHRDAAAFTEEDLRLLEMVAAWTAIAMGNARQYEQLQRRFSERDAIITITNALTETLELEELLRLIANLAQDIIPNADWATIHILQPKTNQLELAASAGLEVHAEADLINLDGGIAGHVIVAGEVVNVSDVQTDPRCLPAYLGVHAGSLLVAPVESRFKRIGAISVQCVTASIFTADDERLLKILGVQAGMAIENARLFVGQRRAREKAEKQRERMRHMARRVMQAQEKERTRIARELHDESGQSLTSLKISLDLIRSLVPEELSDIRQGLSDVLALTDQTMSNLRLLSHNLRPPGLDAFGLDAALAGLCQDFETHTPLSVTYAGVALPELAALPALSLYRVTQEALTNINKHAQATKAWVSLTQDSDMITLTIRDNGNGFSPPNIEETLPAQGAGLAGMVERLEMVHGRLHIESTPGQGSSLTAVVPYTREET
ncbi:MAG: GAF domain-containing protein [Anaerolineae bacterium]|nr:GAF domain-containing protein [Anaerolineae bacterium]